MDASDHNVPWLPSALAGSVGILSISLATALLDSGLASGPGAGSGALDDGPANE